MALDQATFGVSPEPRRTPRGPLGFLTFPFRFLFRLVKRSIASVLRLIVYHPVSSLIVVVLAAALGFLGYRDYAPSVGLSAPAARGTLAMAPSQAAENFIKGQETFDAGLMWNSFSDDLKKQLSSRGTNQQSLQRQLDQRKQAGNKVDDVKYVGGAQTPDGQKLFFYVLFVEAPGGQGVAENHYVLTVDQNDKIITVE